MQDNREKLALPLISKKAKDSFIRWKCPHCGKILTKTYRTNTTYRFCHYCGGEIQK